jgi:predicted nucleic acid-binding protein
MVVVDTDILIWILRGDEKIKRRFTNLVIENKGFVFITPIQIAEIFAGVREKEMKRTKNFLESFNIIDIDKQIGETAGQFIFKYGKTDDVAMADALIGASAKLSGFKLWTLNKRHYPMFENKEFVE